MFAQETKAEEGKAVVLRLFDALNRGDLDAIDDLVAWWFVGHRPELEESRSLPVHALRRTLAGLRAAFPDLMLTVDQVVAEGDTVAVRYRLGGTQGGEYHGHAPSGRHAEWLGMLMSRVDGGKIVETWVAMDELGLRRQLGMR